MFFWRVYVEAELPGNPQGVELVGVVAMDANDAVRLSQAYVELRPTFAGKNARVIGLSREAAVNAVSEAAEIIRAGKTPEVGRA